MNEKFIMSYYIILVSEILKNAFTVRRFYEQL